MTSPFFPPKTLQKMKKIGVSEATVRDVFRTGKPFTSRGGAKMMVKKYAHQGYEIGLFYARDRLTGRYAITAVWKRMRR